MGPIAKKLCEGHINRSKLGTSRFFFDFWPFLPNFVQFWPFFDIFRPILASSGDTIGPISSILIGPMILGGITSLLHFLCHIFMILGRFWGHLRGFEGPLEARFQQFLDNYTTECPRYWCIIKSCHWIIPKLDIVEGFLYFL